MMVVTILLEIASEYVIHGLSWSRRPVACHRSIQTFAEGERESSVSSQVLLPKQIPLQHCSSLQEEVGALVPTSAGLAAPLARGWTASTPPQASHLLVESSWSQWRCSIGCYTASQSSKSSHTYTSHVSFSSTCAQVNISLSLNKII